MDFSAPPQSPEPPPTFEDVAPADKELGPGISLLVEVLCMLSNEPVHPGRAGGPSEEGEVTCSTEVLALLIVARRRGGR